MHRNILKSAAIRVVHSTEIDFKINLKVYGERNTAFHAVTATEKNPLRKGFFMVPRDYRGIKLPEQSINRTDPLPSPLLCVLLTDIPILSDWQTLWHVKI